MAKDVLITPGNGSIEFSNTGGSSVGFISVLDPGTIKIEANSISLGNTSADVYIGNGSDSVDIIFEQSGAIRGVDGAVLTIGGANSSVSFGANVDYLPVTGTVNAALFTSQAVVGAPILQVENFVILRRTSTNGALELGVDDSVHIGAGEAHGQIRGRFANTSEEVVLGGEGGVYAVTASNNWSEGLSNNQILAWKGINTTVGAGLGIGNTVPAHKLRVEGDASIATTLSAGNTTITGFANVTGAITCTTLTETSSVTFKENINPIENALNYVSQLIGVTYDRKDGSAKQRAGLIAEDVEQVLPNVVQKDEDGNPSGIQYTNLIAYLIESIKELKAEIDVLKGK